MSFLFQNSTLCHMCVFGFLNWTAAHKQSKSRHQEVTVLHCGVIWIISQAKKVFLFTVISIHVVIFVLPFKGHGVFCKTQCSEQNVCCEVEHIGNVQLTPLVLPRHHWNVTFAIPCCTVVIIPMLLALGIWQCSTLLYYMKCLGHCCVCIFHDLYTTWNK